MAEQPEDLVTSYRFPYVQPLQARRGEPSAWEMELAGAIESIFATGAHSLEALIAGLNASRLRPPAGGPWTAENYTALMRKLAA